MNIILSNTVGVVSKFSAFVKMRSVKKAMMKITTAVERTILDVLFLRIEMKKKLNVMTSKSVNILQLKYSFFETSVIREFKIAILNKENNK